MPGASRSGTKTCKEKGKEAIAIVHYILPQLMPMPNNVIAKLWNLLSMCCLVVGLIIVFVNSTFGTFTTHINNSSFWHYGKSIDLAVVIKLVTRGANDMFFFLSELFRQHQYQSFFLLQLVGNCNPACARAAIA